MSTVRLWDELTRDEIGELAPSALLVLPVGTTEQHGPHLATGTDAAIAKAVALLAAAAATRPETILISPTLAYGASDHHLPFGGTLSLGVETFELVLADLLASAAAAGVRRAFVLNAHGGNAAACAIAVAEASREHGLIAATALVGALVDGSGHAGVFETSVMLALAPELVRMDRAAPSPGGSARTRPPGVVVGEPGRWEELDGYTDRPDEASQERGGEALAACVAAAAAAFEHVADISA
jgi:creatinine amidohydrolase